MGWAEQLPSGKYRAVYRDRAGKRRSAGTYPHKRAAQKAADIAEDEARKAGWRDPSAALITWDEWCTAWWNARSASTGTLARDTSPLERYIRPYWATVPLIDITRQDVRAWTTQLRRGTLGTRPLAAASVLRYLSIFSASLSAAVDAGILQSNPAIGLKLPPAAPGAERYLTDEEYSAIAEQLDERDLAITNWLVGTGMRWGEMAGFHVHRIDHGRGMLDVVETWEPRSGTITPYPKGKKRREVPLLPWVADTLPPLMKLHSCGIVHDEGRCRSALVFQNSRGGPEDVANWTKRVLTPATIRADVGHVRAHDFRHTYASWLLQAGVPLAEVGRLLGHTDSKTTERYAHLAATPRALVLDAMPSPFVGQTWGTGRPQDARITSIRPNVS